MLCLFTYSNTRLGKRLYNSIFAAIHNTSDIDHTKMQAKKLSEFSTVSLNSHTADVPIMKMFKVTFTFFKGEAIYYSSSCTSMVVIYTHFPPDMAYSVSSASRSQPINIYIKLKVLIKKKTCCTDIIRGLSVK